MKKFLKVMLPLGVLALAAVVSWALMATRPTAGKFHGERELQALEVAPLVKQEYQVKILTQGTVKARTQSTLIPEIVGRIVKVSSSFREGGFFEPNEELIKIDDTDYQAAVLIAASNLAQAATALEEEKARGAQALDNWKRLGRGGKPSPLVLRKPQLAEAEAAYKSAEGQHLKAKRDVARTSISAPYAGRILEQNVDVGQYVSPGTTLATIYAVDNAEIRLPLTNEQLGFLDLPEAFRGEREKNGEKPHPKVDLIGRIGGKPVTWRGEVVRTEGAIDIRSRQQFVVAQVHDPYGRNTAGRPPLKVGMFVDAVIHGKTLRDVYLIPRSALREGRIVLVVDSGNRLRRRTLDVLWGDPEHVVARDGINEGERLCLASISFLAEGTEVKPVLVDGDIVRPPEPAEGPNPANGQEMSEPPNGGASSPMPADGQETPGSRS